MHKTILFLTIVFVTASCGQTEQKASSENQSFSDSSLVSHSEIESNWYDELLSNYIKKSDNTLIKFSRQDTTIRIEYLLDRIENTDSAKYFIFHIGHDVADEGNTNPRFVTDGWVYIDSLTRTLYEYDLPNDNLIKWTR